MTRVSQFDQWIDQQISGDYHIVLDMEQQILGRDVDMVGNPILEQYTITARRNGNNLELAVNNPQSPETSGIYFSQPAAEIKSLTIRGADDDETIRIEGDLWAGDPIAQRSITIEGRAGDDTIVIGTATAGNLIHYSDTITVDGGTGSDSLIINDVAPNAAHTYDVRFSSVTRLLRPAINYENLEGLTLNTGSGGNTINVRSTMTNAHTTVNSGAGNDTVTISSALQTLDGFGDMTVNGQGGNNDRLIVNDSLNAGDQAATVQADRIIRQGGPTIYTSGWQNRDLRQPQNPQGAGNQGNTLLLDGADAGELLTVETGDKDDAITFALAGVLPVNSSVAIEGGLGRDQVSITQRVVATDQVVLQDTEDLHVSGDGFSLGGLSAAGSFAVTGDYVQTAGGVLYMELGYPGSGSDQLIVNETVTLDGALTLGTLSGFSAGTFVLIDNAGQNSVIGTFDDLAEGAVFSLGGASFSISYVGGDGNDVTVTALPPNQPPYAGQDYYNTLHDQTLTTYANQPEYGVLYNDYDPDSDPLAVTAVNGDSAAIGNAVTLPSGATLTMQADGSFVYTTASGWTGQDSFTYTVSDGIDSETATAYINVTNQPPYVNNDYYYTLHDQSLTTYAGQYQYGALYNDFDYDGDPLTVTAVNGNGSDVGSQILLPSGGALTLNADGSFTYAPPSGWTGQDSFSYTASDGIDSGTATVYINVTNQPPIANNDYYNTMQGQPLSISTIDGLFANDYDYDGDDLLVVKVNGSSENVGTQITLTSGATLTVEEDGSFTYTPAAGFQGVDSFTYEVTDGITTSLATVFINVF